MKIKKSKLNKVILTDADGVLLNWEWAFNVHMMENGFAEVEDSKLHYDMAVRYGITREQVVKLIRNFNASAAIGFLPPQRDAVYYVKKLHEKHGYKFHCITSVSADENAQKLREMNIQKIFGETTFERIVCLDTGAPKDDVLQEYEGTGLYWVEDHIKNAEVGYELGLNPLLMVHGHNMDHEHPGITPVKNWQEIYQLITGEND